MKLLQQCGIETNSELSVFHNKSFGEMTPTFVAQNYKWNIYKDVMQVIKTSIRVGSVLTAFSDSGGISLQRPPPP